MKFFKISLLIVSAATPFVTRAEHSGGTGVNCYAQLTCDSGRTLYCETNIPFRWDISVCETHPGTSDAWISCSTTNEAHLPLGPTYSDKCP